jgi:hypothetical protein
MAIRNVGSTSTYLTSAAAVMDAEPRDVLRDGTGNDKLSGRKGADTFIFEAGSGKDKIVGFSDTGVDGEDDTLDLSAYGLRWSDLTFVERPSDNLVIKLGDGNSIAIKNYLASHTTDDLRDNIIFDFEYSAVDVPGVIVTGVRSDSATTDDVVVTASYTTGGTTSAALYQGSLQDLASAPASQWNVLTPNFTGQTVTSSTFYGPNTPTFDPSLGIGEIRAVGSYKYAEGMSGPNFDHGMIYQGQASGSGGTWTQIDATSLVGTGDTLLNTIAHSTMGNLVVGNYDTALSTGHAFIYDLPTGEWTNLNPAGSLSVTAYGIWQNDDSTSTSYTIAGGYSDLKKHSLDAGYLVDYNSDTHAFSHFTTFEFDNLPRGAHVTHIDGITGTADGYNITGDFFSGKTVGGFFAHIERRADGSFTKPDWTEVAYPGDEVTLTSGNTVIDDTVLGIYVADGETRSFVASAAAGWEH